MFWKVGLKYNSMIFLYFLIPCLCIKLPQNKHNIKAKLVIILKLPFLGQEQESYQFVYCQIAWEVMNTSNKGNVSIDALVNPQILVIKCVCVLCRLVICIQKPLFTMFERD